MKNYTLFAFFLSFALYANQDYEYSNFSSDSLRFVLKKTDKVALIFNKSVVEVSENKIDTYELFIEEKIFEKDLNYKNFDVVYDSENQPWFVREGLGEVFFLEGNTFKRIDFSAKLDSNLKSLKAFHDSKIYAFFGFGFFENKNIPLYFNFIYKEWNQVSLNNNEYIPEKREAPFYHLYNDQLIFLGGSNNKGQGFYDIFKYDFKKYKFEKLGDLTDDFPFKRINKKYNSIQLNDSLSVFFKNWDILIDFKNYNFSYIRNSENVNYDSEFGSSIVTLKDNLFYITDSDNSSALKHIKISDLILQFKEFQPLFKRNSQLSQLITVLSFLIILLIFSFLTYRFYVIKLIKSKSVIKQKNYVTYKNQILILTELESKILDFLITNRSVNFIDLCEIESDKYNILYVRTLTNQSLNSLTDKLKILKTPKTNRIVVLRQKNKFDKRFILINLKGKIIRYDGWFKFIFQLKPN